MKIRAKKWLSQDYEELLTDQKPLMICFAHARTRARALLVLRRTHALVCSPHGEEVDNMTRRDTFPQLVYGRRDPEPSNVTSADELELVQGRKPRATKLRVSKIERRCPTCTRPLSNERRLKNCDSCLERRRRQPRDADSIQTARIFADKTDRRTMTARGRLA